MISEDELQALFRAERAVHPPSFAVEHGLRRLVSDLSANVPPLPIAMGPLKLGLSVIPKWLAGGFALGLIGAGATAPLFTPPSTSISVTPTPSVARIAAARLAQPTVAASSEQDSEPATAIARARGRSAAPPAPGAPVPSSATPASFDAELKLISFAKGELDARRPDRARAWLNEHAERFPHGVFVVEREALLALSSCEQEPRNVSLAERFALQHPNSPLLERLARACRLNLDPSKSPNGSAAPGERMAEPSAGEKR